MPYINDDRIVSSIMVEIPLIFFKRGQGVSAATHVVSSHLVKAQLIKPVVLIQSSSSAHSAVVMSG